MSIIGTYIKKEFDLQEKKRIKNPALFPVHICEQHAFIKSQHSAAECKHMRFTANVHVTQIHNGTLQTGIHI